MGSAMKSLAESENTTTTETKVRRIKLEVITADWCEMIRAFSASVNRRLNT